MSEYSPGEGCELARVAREAVYAREREVEGEGDEEGGGGRVCEAERGGGSV